MRGTRRLRIEVIRSRAARVTRTFFFDRIDWKKKVKSAGEGILTYALFVSLTALNSNPYPIYFKIIQCGGRDLNPRTPSRQDPILCAGRFLGKCSGATGGRDGPLFPSFSKCPARTESGGCWLFGGFCVLNPEHCILHELNSISRWRRAQSWPKVMVEILRFSASQGTIHASKRSGANLQGVSQEV